MNSAMIGSGDLEGRHITASMLKRRDIWWKILSFVFMIQILSEEFASEITSMQSVYITGYLLIERTL